MGIVIEMMASDKGVRRMGYVLPISQIRSQQYAIRMTMDPYNFASVGSVYPVKLKPDLFEEVEKKHPPTDKKNNTGEGRLARGNRSSPPYNSYIRPNPANLSPAIAKVVGKGMSVNTYI